MSIKTTYTDYELVRAIHFDNKEVLNYLLEQNFRHIRKYIGGNGGSEVQAKASLQDAIIELWFNINHQNYKPEKDLNTYLFMLVKDRWDKQENVNDFYNKITDSGIKAYDKDIIAKCVEVLEPQLKSILSYHFFEGYDNQRIASILNLNGPDVAENKLNEAKKQLQALLIIRYPGIDVSKDYMKIIACGIREFRYKELVDFMNGNAVIPKIKRYASLAWVLGILIIILGGVGTWIYSNDYTNRNNEKKEETAINKMDSAADNSSKTKESIHQKKYHLNKESGKDVDTLEEEHSSKDSLKNPDMELPIPKGKIQTVTSNGDIIIKEVLDTTSSGEMVVRKDELLFTIYSKVAEKLAAADTLGENKEGLMANKTAEMLNPEAKLPKEDAKIKVYQVELWKSPINYKGYKMQKNKVIIFGIENPELIKLISFDEGIYLQSGPTFYLLIPSIDFRPFIKLKDKSILAELTK
ncbi:MAG: sigma-70 family RNA polymerase sigma factor [Bacteroidota bacterium]